MLLGVVVCAARQRGRDRFGLLGRLARRGVATSTRSRGTCVSKSAFGTEVVPRLGLRGRLAMGAAASEWCMADFRTCWQASRNVAGGARLVGVDRARLRVLGARRSRLDLADDLRTFGVARRRTNSSTKQLLLERRSSGRRSC